MTKHRDPKRERATRLMLLQLRGRTVYSTGDKVYEGEDLALLKRKLVHDLIQRRLPKTDLPFQMRAQSNALAWQNFTQLSGLYAKQAVIQGHEPWTLIDRISQHVRPDAACPDPGSQNRNRILRRALRRQFPDKCAKTDISSKASAREISHIVEGKNRRAWVTREDLDIDGMSIRKGAPCLFGRDGYPEFVDERFPRGVLSEADLRAVRTGGKGNPSPTPEMDL